MPTSRREHVAGADTAATVCIVGAGPAGITLALALSEAKIDTLLVDSGGSTARPEAQALNFGTVVGDARLRLHDTRQRQLGGTVNIWNTPVGAGVGAKYVPLDPGDFDRRPSAELPGWPIEFSDLEPHYRAAQEICGLGPFEYSGSVWSTPDRVPFEFQCGGLTSKVYQFGRANQFLQTHLNRLKSSDAVRIVTNLTVFRLVATTASEIREARAVTGAGTEVRIKARLFVLAAGAIENARLLLMSRADLGGMSSAAASWLGRCFMEHPRDCSLKLVAKSPTVFERARFYDATIGTSGVMTCGRLAFDSGPLQGAALPNMSVTLLPCERSPGIVTRALRRVGLARSRGGYGWSSIADPAQYFDGFRLLINLEQRPQPVNRVALSADRDGLGMPRCEVHWNWGAEDQASLVRLRTFVAEHIESLGLGRVECAASELPDPNAHHHAGTTRMAGSAEFGVVNADARVFGLDNLYVAGASVFPTAGFANPVLTIVALADRLGRHLAVRG